MAVKNGENAQECTKFLHFHPKKPLCLAPPLEITKLPGRSQVPLVEVAGLPGKSPDNYSISLLEFKHSYCHSMTPCKL